MDISQAIAMSYYLCWYFVTVSTKEALELLLLGKHQTINAAGAQLLSCKPSPSLGMSLVVVVLLV